MPGPGPSAAGPAAKGSSATSAVEGLLAQLPQRPVEEHLETYDAVHRLLQRELSRLDEG